MSDKQQALIPIEDNKPVLSPVDAALADAELLKTLQEIAQKSTKPWHWECFGSDQEKAQVRLNRKGAEHIAVLTGTSIQCVDKDYQEFPDGHFIYMYTYRATARDGRILEFTGSCRSDHQFWFANAGKNIKRVDKTNIMRHAQSNAISNVIGRLWGIHNIPLNEFESITGHKSAKVNFATFDKKEPKKSIQGRAQPTKKLSGSAPPITDADIDWGSRK